jgi:transposase
VGSAGKVLEADAREARSARRKSGTLHLAQAQSNRGRRGRKRDFVDAERLVKRLVARELTLSFVPDAEQRLWRTVTRKKYQLRRDRVRLHNQLESLLEEAHTGVDPRFCDNSESMFDKVCLCLTNLL